MGILHIGADGNLETGNDRNQYLNVLKVWDEKLKLLLALGERYKEEGEKMKNEFWINQGNSEFYDLVEKFEESKEKFIEGLKPEEKSVINILNEKEREKFFKEYLYELILYGMGTIHIKGVKDWNEELKLLLTIGEKYKKEGEKMKNEFWKSYGEMEYNVLLVKFEESKEKFIEGLEPEEKRVINSLNEIEKEKYLKEYLYERILYSGDLSKNGETGILENSDVKNEWGVSDEDLKLLISIGEKYEKEGGEMYQDFRESGSVDVLNKKLKVLLVKFEESKEKFIEGLKSEEKRVINSLNEKEREKFFKRYLNERILYGGDVEQK